MKLEPVNVETEWKMPLPWSSIYLSLSKKQAYQYGSTNIKSS